MTKYIDIIFLQYYDDSTPFDLLKTKSESAALQYLTQWDYGEGAEIRNEPPAGKSDTVYKEGDYIMNYNLSLGYIGLVRVIHE